MSTLLQVSRTTEGDRPVEGGEWIAVIDVSKLCANQMRQTFV